jgi:hypothetical protein
MIGLYRKGGEDKRERKLWENQRLNYNSTVKLSQKSKP